MRRWQPLLLTLVLLGGPLAGQAWAGEGDWETAVTGPITIKNRAVPKSPIREIWAEGEIAAPVQDIQATSMDVSRFRHFMPFVTDAREISPKLADGSVYVYTCTNFPVVGKRDYVVRTWLVEGAKPDPSGLTHGSGAFRNRWEAFPDYIPERSDIVRIRVDSGSWVVTPIGDGSKSWAVYKFMVDPGGWIPAFAANLGNQKGVAETYRAMELEAQRRRDERVAAAKKRDAGVSTDAGAPQAAGARPLSSPPPDAGAPPRP